MMDAATAASEMAKLETALNVVRPGFQRYENAGGDLAGTRPETVFGTSPKTVPDTSAARLRAMTVGRLRVIASAFMLES